MSCLYGPAAGPSLCTINGTTPFAYYNPTTGLARITLTATSTLTWGNAAAGCFLGTGQGSGTHQELRLTAATGGPAPHTGPVFTRTA